MTHFAGFDYRSHTSCISEAQKYQGKLYKEKPAKGKGGKGGQQIPASQAVDTPAVDAGSVERVSVIEPKADSAVVPATTAEKDPKDDTKSTKKRKQDETIATSTTPTDEGKAVDAQPVPSKKTKKSKKDGTGAVAEATNEAVAPTTGAVDDAGTIDRSPLLVSFVTIAKKELASKDEIDMARVIKKWKKKNGQDELETLWKVLGIRKGTAGELIIQ